MTVSLLQGRLSPLTNSIGFLNASIVDVGRAMSTFIAGLPTMEKGEVVEVLGTLEECLLALQPLTVGIRPRILLASTKAPGWTAVFDADARGQGVAQDTSRMARNLGVRGYFFGSSLPSRCAPGQLGGRHFRVLGPEGSLGIIHSVDLIENNPGRWYFEVDDRVQPFEDVSAYDRRRKTERLTDEMLVEYAAAVGLRPWDEDFYTSPYYIVTNDVTGTAKYFFSLEQARQNLELPATY